MGSSRLPGKVLAPLVNGKPLLELLVERTQTASLPHATLVATGDSEANVPIIRLCEKLGVPCFRGSEEDVLGRVLDAARTHAIDLIVRLTGDNPLIDGEIIDDVVRFYLDGGYDYVATTTMSHSLNWKAARTFPRGIAVQVLSTKLLAAVDERTTDPLEREVVTFYVYDRPEEFRLGAFQAEGKYERCRHPDLRLTVDAPEDLELMRRIFGVLYPANPRFTVADAIQLVASDNGLRTMNARVPHKLVHALKEPSR
jgi:spore coat polysaccharide biosynthesis protein SpsF